MSIEKKMVAQIRLTIREYFFENKLNKMYEIRFRIINIKRELRASFDKKTGLLLLVFILF